MHKAVVITTLEMHLLVRLVRSTYTRLAGTLYTTVLAERMRSVGSVSQLWVTSPVQRVAAA